MQRLWFGLLSCIALASCKPSSTSSKAAAVAAEPVVADRPLPVDPRVIGGQLGNGVTYLLRPGASTGQGVALVLAVRAGSLKERDDERGFAHFVEHVAFDRAQRFGAVAPLDFLQRLGVTLGADLNASVGHSETLYRLSLPRAEPELLATALDVMLGWASEVRFEADAVERQRSIVLAELGERSREPQSLGERMVADALGDSRYWQRDPLGVESVLRTAKPAQLRAFYESHYHAGALAVIATGQFDPGELTALIEQRFGKLPGKAAPPAREHFPVSVTPGDHGILLRAADFGQRSSQVRVLLQLPRAVGSHERAEWQRLVDRCLCDVLAARLRRRERGDDAALDNADCGVTEDGGGQLGLLLLSAEARAGRLRAALEAVLLELERLRQHGFGEEELRRQKSLLLTEIERSTVAAQTGSLQALALRMAQHFTRGTPLLGPEQERELTARLLAGIDVATLRSRALEWSGGRRSVYAVHTDEDGSVSSSSELAALVAAVKTRSTSPLRDAVSPDALMARLPEPGSIAASEHIEPLELSIWTLDNGARVVFRPARRGTREVLVRAISPGGASHSSDAMFWNAALAPVLVRDSGVAKHDREALQQLLEGSGVRVEPWLDDVSEGLIGSSATEESETLFQLVHLYMTSPRADSESFAALRHGLAQSVSEPETRLRMALDDALYTGARRAMPTPDQFEALDRDTALGIYRDRFGNAGDFTFVVVADLEERGVRALVERYLASLPGSPRADAPPVLDLKRRGGVQRVRVSGRPGTRSKVFTTFHGVAEQTLENDADLELLASALRRRLRHELREQLGAVYDLEVITSWDNGQYVLTVVFDCAPGDVARLQEATLRTIGELERSGVPEDVLQSLAAERADYYRNAVTSNEFWAVQLEQLYRTGGDPRRLLELPRLAERVTLTQLRQAARQYLDQSRYLDAVWQP